MSKLQHNKYHLHHNEIYILKTRLLVFYSIFLGNNYSNLCTAEEEYSVYNAVGKYADQHRVLAIIIVGAGNNNSSSSSVIFVAWLRRLCSSVNAVGSCT